MNHEKHEKTRKKKAATKPAENTEMGFRGLTGDIREIISQARSLTRRSVNSLQVVSNYLIGMRIVLEEQSGQERADYGKAILKGLSEELTKEFGRGYSRRNLEYVRKFYLTYSPLPEVKTQTVSAFFDNPRIDRTPSEQPSLEKSQTLSGKLNITQIVQALSAQLPLSWSHYLYSLHMLKTELLKILKNTFSCISRLSRLKNICVYSCLSVVPNSFSVCSVCSVVKNGGMQ